MRRLHAAGVRLIGMSLAVLGCSEPVSKPENAKTDVCAEFRQGSIPIEPVEWYVTADDQGAGIHTIFMIAEVRSVSRLDIESVGGKLIWDETQIDLCATPNPAEFGLFISIRDEFFDGEPVVHIGDGFQSNEQGPGCEINAEMGQAFDDFGLPEAAAIWVRTTRGDAEYCAPLELGPPDEPLNGPVGP